MLILDVIEMSLYLGGGMTEEWNEYQEYYKKTLAMAVDFYDDPERLDYFQWLVALLITKKILNHGNLIKWYDKCSMDINISRIRVC